MEKEVIYQVPPEGSLGLLALGHIGLILWRNARKEYEEETGMCLQSFYTAEKANNVTALAQYTKSQHES
mgnify:FL=1